MKIALADLKYDERGLLPTIVQDARTGEVLTLAYMSAESLRRTLDTGETWFWSRSRRALWHKGETSGHTQRVVEMRADCDGDALLARVEPRGAACHTGQRTCFHQQLDEANFNQPASHPATELAETETGDASAPSRDFGAVVSELYRLIETRRRERPNGAYTTYLFNEGLDKILKKVGEEAAETIIAAKNEDERAFVGEATDLVYHLLVLLVERGTRLDDISAELERRSQRGRSKQ